jgi:catechol 2,3-dioxygenase-like lactoylglutathione lyase family enzyme
MIFRSAGWRRNFGTGRLSGFERARAAVSRVESVGLTVSEMDRAPDFYTRVLPFEKVSDNPVSLVIKDCLMEPRKGAKIMTLFSFSRHFAPFRGHQF